MGTSFKQHFAELDCLLQGCTVNIDERHARIRRLITSAICMTRKDGCDTPFIPASEKEWKCFYKCPEKFRRKYNYNASQEYYPTILDENCEGQPPMSERRSLNSVLVGKELPFIKLKDVSLMNASLVPGSPPTPKTTTVLNLFSKKIKKLEIADNLEYNILRMAGLLGHFRPVCGSDNSYCRVLCDVATEMAKKHKSIDRQRYCWTVIRVFSIEGRVADKFSYMFRKICEMARLVVLNYEEDANHVSITKKNLACYDGFVFRNKKKLIVPRFFSLYYKKFLLLMAGFVLQKPGKQKYKCVFLKVNLSDLGNIGKLDGKDFLLNFKLVDSVSGKEFTNAKNIPYRLKYILYNKVTVGADFSEVGPGITLSVNSAAEASPKTIFLPGGAASALTLARINKLNKNGGSSSDLMNMVETALENFAKSLNAGLSAKYQNVLDVFDAERKVYVNRFPVIIPAIQKNLPTITIEPVKTTPQQEMQEKLVKELLLPRKIPFKKSGFVRPVAVAALGGLVGPVAPVGPVAESSQLYSILSKINSINDSIISTGSNLLRPLISRGANSALIRTGIGALVGYNPALLQTGLYSAMSLLSYVAGNPESLAAGVASLAGPAAGAAIGYSTGPIYEWVKRLVFSKPTRLTSAELNVRSRLFELEALYNKSQTNEKEIQKKLDDVKLKIIEQDKKNITLDKNSLEYFTQKQIYIKLKQNETELQKELIKAVAESKKAKEDLEKFMLLKQPASGIAATASAQKIITTSTAEEIRLRQNLVDHNTRVNALQKEKNDLQFNKNQSENEVKAQLLKLEKIDMTKPNAESSKISFENTLNGLQRKVNEIEQNLLRKETEINRYLEIIKTEEAKLTAEQKANAAKIKPVAPLGPTGPVAPSGFVALSGPTGPVAPLGLVGPTGPIGLAAQTGIVKKSGPFLTIDQRKKLLNIKIELEEEEKKVIEVRTKLQSAKTETEKEKIKIEIQEAIEKRNIVKEKLKKETDDEQKIAKDMLDIALTQAKEKSKISYDSKRKLTEIENQIKLAEIQLTKNNTIYNSDKVEKLKKELTETKVDYEKKLNEYKKAIELAKKLGGTDFEIKTDIATAIATATATTAGATIAKEKNLHFSVEQKQKILNLMKKLNAKNTKVNKYKKQFNDFKISKKSPEEIEKTKFAYKQAIKEKDNEVKNLDNLMKREIITANENLRKLILTFKKNNENFEKAADAVKEKKESLKKAEIESIYIQTPEKINNIKNLFSELLTAETDMDTKENLLREAYDKLIEVGGNLSPLNIPKNTINLSSNQEQELLIFYQTLAKAEKNLQDKNNSLAKIKEELEKSPKTKESELISKIKIEIENIAKDEAVIEKNKALRELIEAIRKKEIVAKSDLKKAIDNVAKKQANVQKLEIKMADQKTINNNYLNQLKSVKDKNPKHKDNLETKISEIKILIESLSVELSIAQLDLEEAKQEVDKFTIKK